MNTAVCDEGVHPHHRNRLQEAAPRPEVLRQTGQEAARRF